MITLFIDKFLYKYIEFLYRNPFKSTFNFVIYYISTGKISG